MKTLVEDSFALSTKLLRSDLQKARNKDPVDGEYLNFRHNNRPSVLYYSIEYSLDGNTYLVVTVGEEPQKILLSEHQFNFGIRTYFTCGCSQRTNALYLKETFFACRKCQNLRYSSTTINVRSDHGAMLYMASKKLKLMNMREQIGRIFYRSKYTKRFERWLKLCKQAGLYGQIKDALELMEAIKRSQSQQI